MSLGLFGPYHHNRLSFIDSVFFHFSTCYKFSSQILFAVCSYLLFLLDYRFCWPYSVLQGGCDQGEVCLYHWRLLTEIQMRGKIQNFFSRNGVWSDRSEGDSLLFSVCEIYKSVKSLSEKWTLFSRSWDLEEVRVGFEPQFQHLSEWT